MPCQAIQPVRPPRGHRLVEPIREYVYAEVRRLLLEEPIKLDADARAFLNKILRHMQHRTPNGLRTLNWSWIEEQWGGIQIPERPIDAVMLHLEWFYLDLEGEYPPGSRLDVRVTEEV